jgi:hypothetical protein
MSDDPDTSVTQPPPSRSDVTYAEFEWDNVTPLIAVTEALTGRTSDEVANVGPLHEHVDMDALNGLLRSRPWYTPELKVVFRIEGYLVFVDSNGAVRVQPVE